MVPTEMADIRLTVSVNRACWDVFPDLCPALNWCVEWKLWLPVVASACDTTRALGRDNRDNCGGKHAGQLRPEISGLGSTHPPRPVNKWNLYVIVALAIMSIVEHRVWAQPVRGPSLANNCHNRPQFRVIIKPREPASFLFKRLHLNSVFSMDASLCNGDVDAVWALGIPPPPTLPCYMALKGEFCTNAMPWLQVVQSRHSWWSILAQSMSAGLVC